MADRLNPEPRSVDEIVDRARKVAAGLAARLPERERRFAMSLAQEVRDDRVTGLAAEIAFFAVLSIFPWLLLIAAALGWLDAFVGGDVAQQAKRAVVDFLSDVLTEQASGAVAAVRDLFEEERAGLLSVSALVAAWLSARGFGAAVGAINLAYDAQERRSWLQLRVRALGLAVASVVVGSVLLVAFVAGPLLGGGRAVADTLGAGRLFAGAWQWARWPAAFVVVVVLAAIVYRVAPARSRPLRDNLPGAVVAAASWLLASLGFGIYLRVAASGNPIFGALGGALVLLVWLYLLALGLLIGAEVNSLLWGRPTRSMGSADRRHPGARDSHGVDETMGDTKTL